MVTKYVLKMKIKEMVTIYYLRCEQCQIYFKMIQNGLIIYITFYHQIILMIYKKWVIMNL